MIRLALLALLPVSLAAPLEKRQFGWSLRLRTSVGTQAMIGIVPSASLAECGTACQSKSYCRAASFNGNSCNLYSDASPTQQIYDFNRVLLLKEVYSFLFVPGMSVAGSVQVAADFNTCSDLCYQQGCTAFSIDSATGMCSISTDSTLSPSTSTAFVKYQPQSPSNVSFTAISGTDLLEHTMHVSQGDQESCTWFCQNLAGCAGFVLSNTTCSFKSLTIGTRIVSDSTLFVSN